MEHEVREYENPTVAAHKAAAFIVERAQQAVLAKGTFTFAVSGGDSPWPMFEALTTLDMPWNSTVIYQVDERAAPLHSRSRNLENLRRSLEPVAAIIEPMPVDGDLDEGAREYEALLPDRFDLVHLGLGPDGHTASLLLDDPVLDVTDRMVWATQEYMGHRRMTLTYPALARAEQILWLIIGTGERDVLPLLLSGDASIPAGRVRAERSLIFADVAAMAT